MAIGRLIRGAKSRTITAQAVNAGAISATTYNDIRAAESKLRAREASLRYRAKKQGVSGVMGAYGNVRYNYRGDFLRTESEAKKYLNQLTTDIFIGVGKGSFKGGVYTPTSLVDLTARAKQAEAKIRTAASAFNVQGEKLRAMAYGGDDTSMKLVDVRALKGEEANYRITGYQDIGKGLQAFQNIQKQQMPRQKMRAYKDNFVEALRARAEELSYGDAAEKQIANKLSDLASEINNMTEEKFGAHWLAGNLEDVTEWYRGKSAEAMDEFANNLNEKIQRFKDNADFNASYAGEVDTTTLISAYDTATIKQFLKGYRG